MHTTHKDQIACFYSRKEFKSYLENRTQMCFINGSLSNNRSLTCGVPQGTILGPLLFLLYINDLPNCLSNCEPRMYADDISLTYAGDCVDNLQLYLNLQSWTNFFGTLAFISVQCTFFGLQMPPPSPPFNVGHKLVHFQPCTLLSVYFPQATLNGGVGGAKEPRICDKK